MMKDGTIVSQRDIILIPFPYSNLSENKKRPAIVLSNEEYNSKNGDVICCAITSNPRNYERSIVINEKDLDEGNLRYESEVKPNKVFTLSQSLVIKRLAKLNVDKSKEIICQLDFFIKIDE